MTKRIIHDKCDMFKNLKQNMKNVRINMLHDVSKVQTKSLMLNELVVLPTAIPVYQPLKAT